MCRGMALDWAYVRHPQVGDAWEGQGVHVEPGPQLTSVLHTGASTEQRGIGSAPSLYPLFPLFCRVPEGD